jgi:hypothetical protein
LADDPNPAELKRDGFPIMSEAQFDMLMEYIDISIHTRGGIAAQPHNFTRRDVLKAKLRKSLVHGTR